MGPPFRQRYFKETEYCMTIDADASYNRNQNKLVETLKGFFAANGYRIFAVNRSSKKLVEQFAIKCIATTATLLGIHRYYVATQVH